MAIYEGLEETTMLLKSIGKHFEKMKDPDSAAILFGKAEKTTKRAQVIHDSIFKQEQYSEDLRYTKTKKA